jgi:hypothetical protein
MCCVYVRHGMRMQCMWWPAGIRLRASCCTILPGPHGTAQPALLLPRPDHHCTAAPAGASERGYAGEVRQDIDHRAYMPAAWRLDDYLAGDDDVTLDELRSHKLAFSKAAGGDAMARRDDVDDYVVVDPLLERAKGKFSKAEQKERKKQTEWAGRARG